PSGWTRTDSVPVGGTGNIVFTKSGVASGETATFTVVVKVPSSAADGSTITDTATVSTTDSHTNDPTSSNNSQIAMTTVNRQVDLQVTNTDSPDPVIAGSATSNLTYTVTVHNAGPSDASGVQLTNSHNTLPSGVTFVGGSTVTGTFTNGT